MAIKIQNTTVIDDDKSFIIKSGITSERPSSPEEGMIFYNTSNNQYEIYSSNTWKNFIGSGLYVPSGAIQYSSTDMGTGWLALDGSILPQSSYPTLFSTFGYALDAFDNTWVNRTSGVSLGGAINSLKYANGLFLTAHLGGSYSTSTDAITWVVRTVAGWTNEARDIAWGNGIYLICGKQRNIGYSTDAIDWTLTDPSNNTVNEWDIVGYGDGLYIVAAGASYYTSTNAINWTQRTSGIPSGRTLKRYRYLNNTHIINVDSNDIYTSTNAINWSQRIIPVGTSGDQVFSTTYGKGLYVCGQKSGNISTSTNIINWTLRSSIIGVTFDILDVWYANTVFFAAGGSGRMAYSTNGINWKTQSSGTGTTINHLTQAPDQGTFVRAGATAVLNSWYPYSYNYNTEYVLPNLISTARINAESNAIHQAYMKE